MASEKNNVLEILHDVERKVEEFRAAALRLARWGSATCAHRPPG